MSFLNNSHVLYYETNLGGKIVKDMKVNVTGMIIKRNLLL